MCLSRIDEYGLEVVTGYDIREAEKRMTAIGKNPNHPMLSAGWNDFGPEDAFFLILRRNHTDVGGLAVRCLRLGSQTLAQHWTNSHARYYGDGDRSVVKDHKVWAHTISGTAAYLGELFLVPEERNIWQYQAVALTYVKVIAALKWKPDWFCGFVRAEDALRGKPAQYGFEIQVPAVQVWSENVGGRYESEYLVARSYQSLIESAKYYENRPEMFAPKGIQIR